MPSLPTELDFSTVAGRDASPERMNRAMDYLVSKIHALEASRADYDAIVEQLHATGLARLGEALQPVFDQATAMAATLTATQEAIDTDDWRATLIAEIRDAVTAQVEALNLYIKAGLGTTGITVFAGAALPDNALGQNGDLYVQGG